MPKTKPQYRPTVDFDPLKVKYIKRGSRAFRRYIYSNNIPPEAIKLR